MLKYLWFEVKLSLKKKYPQLNEKRKKITRMMQKGMKYKQNFDMLNNEDVQISLFNVKRFSQHFVKPVLPQEKWVRSSKFYHEKR